MLPTSITTISGSRRIVPPGAGLCLLLALLLLTGCAGRNQYFQVLEPGAERFDDPRHSLVLLPLHVFPLESNLKVSGMRFVDPATGNRHEVFLYDNPSLGSAALAYHKLGLEVVQYAALDLPAGSYRLVSVDLAFLWQQADAAIATVAAARDWTLTVDEPVTSYAGRLSVEIEALTVTDQFGERSYRFPLETPMVLYSLDNELRVEAGLRVDDRMPEDLRAIRAEYPALENTGFEKNLLR